MLRYRKRDIENGRRRVCLLKKEVSKWGSGRGARKGGLTRRAEGKDWGCDCDIVYSLLPLPRTQVLAAGNRRCRRRRRLPRNAQDPEK